MPPSAPDAVPHDIQQEILRQLNQISKMLAGINGRQTRLEQRHNTLRQDHLRVKADARDIPTTLESYREQIAALTEIVTILADNQGLNIAAHYDAALETESDQ